MIGFFLCVSNVECCLTIGSFLRLSKAFLKTYPTFVLNDSLYHQLISIDSKVDYFKDYIEYEKKSAAIQYFLNNSKVQTNKNYLSLLTLER